MLNVNNLIFDNIVSSRKRSYLVFNSLKNGLFVTYRFCISKGLTTLNGGSHFLYYLLVLVCDSYLI